MSAFHPLETLELRQVSNVVAAMEHEPEQQALFELQGPDEDDCVWACSPDGRDVWCQNLGPVDKVAEVMSRWLASIDQDENF